MIKLLDYAAQWHQLEASRNPFAVAVMAHLKTKETKNNAEARKEWKFRLTRSLYEQGYERQDILNLFRFIDWLMVLPEELKQAFQLDLALLEQERQMPYITSIEQMAMEKGKAEGKVEERQAIALNMLRKKMPVETIAELTGLTIGQIQQLQSELPSP